MVLKGGGGEAAKHAGISSSKYTTNYKHTQCLRYVILQVHSDMFATGLAIINDQQLM